MKVLMVTPALPWPAHQGGTMRVLGLLKGLHGAGQRISLLSVGPPPEADSPLHGLCEEIVTASPPTRRPVDRLRDLVLSGKPDIALRLVSHELRQGLKELLERQDFDLVQFEGLEVCDLLPLVRQWRPDLPCCYDAFNAEYLLQRNLFLVDRRQTARWPRALWSWLQARRIASFERNICHLARGTLAVSEEDARALRALSPHSPVAVVPNGIFTSHYTLARHGENAVPVLAFTGKMDYRPNVDAMHWFCNRVLPRVVDARPGCQLNIVGQSPHSSLKQLARSRHIHVTGWVEEIQPWLHGCDVYVAPLQAGSGTRLKVLEAMASGCAIVATSVAASGLPPVLIQSIRLADEEGDMANAIIELLDDPQLRRQMGAAAAAAVRETSDWSAILPSLLNAWERIGL
ncbi:MAG: glycosyltransferase [Anaerolineaceae bacterium]|nr:glycosyltransferase [Anaerolineaceae bacterium]